MTSIINTKKNILIFLFFVVQTHTFAQKFLNLGFEHTLSNGVITSWRLSPYSPFFKIKTDTVIRVEGKNSISIERITENPKGRGMWGSISIVVDTIATKFLKNKTIKLVAWVKVDTNEIRRASMQIYLTGNKNFDSTSFSLIKLDKEKGEYRLESEAPLDSMQKVKRIVVGFTFTGAKKVWFDDLKIFIDGIQLKDGLTPKDTMPLLTPPQYNSLNNRISVLDTHNLSTNFKDLEKALSPFTKAKIIGLGEATHGTREFNQIRHRIIQYLVQNEAYDYIVFEGGVFEINRLNDFIQNPNTKEDLKSLMGAWYGVWNTTEVYELIQWAKNYNKISPLKIKFIGMDVTKNSEIALKQLDDWAIKSKDTNAVSLVNQFKLLAKKEQYYLMDSLLNKISERYKKEKQTDENAWQEIEFNALKQYGQYYDLSPRRFPVLVERFRDSCMAANLMWYKNQHPQSKFIIWAHNGHITKGKTAAGNHLSKKFGKDYIGIAQTTASGSYTGFTGSSVDSKWYKSDLVAPYNGTWENVFTSLKHDNFLLFLNEKEKKEFTPYPFLSRDIGSLITEYQFSRFYDLINDFDAVIFLKQTTASENFNRKN
jgi:erythromycin esterase